MKWKYSSYAMAGKLSGFTGLWTPGKWNDNCLNFKKAPHNARATTVIQNTFLTASHSVFSDWVWNGMLLVFFVCCHAVLLEFLEYVSYLQHKWNLLFLPLFSVFSVAFTSKSRNYFSCPVHVLSSKSGRNGYIFLKVFLVLELLRVLSLLTWFHTCEVSTLFTRRSVLRRYKAVWPEPKVQEARFF